MARIRLRISVIHRARRHLHLREAERRWLAIERLGNPRLHLFGLAPVRSGTWHVEVATSLLRGLRGYRAGFPRESRCCVQGDGVRPVKRPPHRMPSPDLLSPPGLVACPRISRSLRGMGVMESADATADPGEDPDITALIPVVRRVIRARVSDASAAEDLVQETLVRVLGA